MDKIGEWQIEKYARTTVRAAEEGKEWETLDNSPTRPLALILTRGGILKVQVGRLLLEYWNLLQVKDMTTHTRGDCMLFLCKTKVDVRKWRVRFAGGTVVGEERCAACARAVDAFLTPTTPLIQPHAPSLVGLEQAGSAPSLTGLQSTVPAPSLAGLQPAPPAPSMLGLQPVPPAPLHTELYRFPLTSPALPLRPVPILATSRVIQHPSGPNVAMSQGSYTLASPVNVSSSIIQDNPMTATTAVTLANYYTSNCVGYSGEGVDKTDPCAGGKRARLATQGSSDRDPISQGSTAVGVGTDPASATRAPSLLEALGDSPSLEQMVQAVLLDPSLPDLVDAVHKVISDM